MKAFLTTIFVWLFLQCSFAQFTVQTNSNVSQLVNQFVGDGINIVGTPTKYCNSNGTATFYNGHLTSCPIDSGIVLCTGYASFLDRSYSYTASAGLNYGMNDADLLTLNSSSNTDICYIEFDFTPDYDTLSFEYVFGSEEYLEWVGSVFNDVFGFFLTGPDPNGGTYNKLNLAKVPSSSDIVSINTINNISNPSYYINNYPDGSVAGLSDPNFTLDGFTTVMPIGLSLVAGSQYTIKLVIGDVSDPLWDSYVLLRRSSFRSEDVITSLPLTLIEFDAQYIEDEVRIHWTTENEKELSHFMVQRSFDGIHWSDLARVESSNHSLNTMEYSRSFKIQENGWQYFRLKSVDKDQRYELSEIKALLLPDLANVQIRPTLVPRGQFIAIESQETIDNVNILSHDGKEIHSGSLESANRHIASLPVGHYIIQVKCRGDILSQRITIF